MINYKGGVGKTTVTANLGAELAHRGHRVLLVDLDAQCSLTFSFVKPDFWKTKLADSGTIKAWFDSFTESRPLNLQDLIYTPSPVSWRVRNGDLHLIPSHLGLINVDLELATELGGATLKQAKKNYLRVHRRLAEGLDDLDESYDLVLIDCPPNFNVVTKTAIVASENLLIPAKPDYLSTLGIDYLRRSLDQLVADYNEYAQLDGDLSASIDPKFLGIVFTMVSFYAQQPVAAMRPFITQAKKLGLPVFDAMVRENKTLFGGASQHGVPVVLTHQTPGTYGTIVDELEALTSEFLRRMV